MNTDWMARAECQYVDPELWFPEQGKNAPQARLICARCEVRAECLDYAVNATERLDGIWGGLTETDRRKLRLGRLVRAS